MWTCYNCGNSKNLDAEDSCGLCEKIRRKDTITTEDSKPSEGDIEKEHNGNTAVTSAPGTSGPTSTCDRIVPKPINNSPLPEGNSDTVGNGDEEAQILKVMNFGYSRTQAMQIREQQKIFSSRQRPSISNPQSSRAATALSRSNAAIASPSTRVAEPEVIMEKIFYQGNPLDERFRSAEKPIHEPTQLSPENQLIEELTSLGIDEEVCKALLDMNLLDVDGLKYIIDLDAKLIADMLNVTVGKVIPAKFKDRVNRYLKSIKPVEDTSVRDISNDISHIDAASNHVARKLGWVEPVKSDAPQTPFWACKRCTVHNSITARTCSMCYASREDSPESLKVKGPFSNDEHPLPQKPSPQDTPKKTPSKYIPESVQKDDPRPPSQSPSSAYLPQDEVLKPIVFDKANRHVYWLLTGNSNASQYTLGAVSACTTMAVQAAFSLLRNVRGKDMPFGITSEILDGILKVGAQYQNSNHQDILEVLKSSTDLSRTLIHMKGPFAKNGMVDLDLNDPYPALTIGNDLKNKYGTNVCAIITCQAQSVCLFYENQSDSLILFDSHSRMYNGVNHGAAMLFFERMDSLIAYLKVIFPAIEQPDIRYQSEMEQLQYAHMMLAQADFLCLRAAITVFPGDEVESIPHEKRRKSLDGPSNVSSHAPSHPQGWTMPPAAPLHDIGSANQIAQLYAERLAEQKAASEKLHDASIKATRLETELKHEREAVGELKKRVEQLEKENKFLREENAKLKEKKPFQPPHHPARKPPNTRIQQQPHQQSPPPSQQKQAKATPQPAETVFGKMPAYSYKDDELLARQLMEEDMRANNDAIFARALQEEEERKMQDVFNRDVEIARRFESDAEAARLQAERLAEEERRLVADAELAREIAEAGVFRCVICMEEVSTEDVFDLDHDNHKICRECGTAYVNNALKDKNFPIKCPFNRCTHIISETKCFEVLKGELYGELYDLSSRPHSDPGFRQCPVPDCKGFDLLDAVNAGDCQCQRCQHRWCCNCQVDLEQSQHKDIPCEKYQEWKRNNDTGDDQMEEFLRQGLNDSEGEFRMRRCPKCLMAFMKDKACMHVVCIPLGGGCGTHFCFRCAQFAADDAASIYNHQGSCPGFQADP